jgi:hypothetical protein
MKVKVSPVILFIVVAAVGLYAYSVWTTPRVNIVVKKEGFSDQSVGSILGMVFAGIMGVGIMVALFGTLVEGPYRSN